MRLSLITWWIDGYTVEAGKGCVVLKVTMVTLCVMFFFFNDTATTEIYTLSLHAALPIYFGNLDPLIVDNTRRFAILDRYRLLAERGSSAGRIGRAHV